MVGSMRRASPLAVLTACTYLAGVARALYVEDGIIYSKDGKPVVMHGTHMFGLQTSANAAGIDSSVLGLESLALDWKTVVWRVEQLGFNAIRLPFSFWFIDQPMKNYTMPCTVTSRADLIKSVTPPGMDVSQRRLLSEPPRVPGGICNSDMPDDYWERLIWTICYYTSRGFYVAIDHHLDYDNKETTGSPVGNITRLTELYMDLVVDLQERNCTRDRFIIDWINEPDTFGFFWDRANNTIPLAEAYKRLIVGVESVCDDCLYMVEGVDQWRWPTISSWGDGFATHPAILAYSEQYWRQTNGSPGITGPGTFFEWLVAQPRLMEKVVVAPHVYCPRVTLATSAFSGSELWRRITDTFGYLTYEGYVDRTGKNHTLPVVLGEMGTGFQDDNEIKCYTDLAAWMFNTRPEVSVYPKEAFMTAYGDNWPIYSGRHANIDSWFWWVWNPNSDDTGGLLTKDWKTINWESVSHLTGDNPKSNRTGLNLQPWYKPPSPAVTVSGRKLK